MYLHSQHPRTKPKAHKCHGVTNGNVNIEQISFNIGKKMIKSQNHNSHMYLL